MQILINPPADVQASVAAVIKACHGWQPTEVQPLPPGKTIGPDAPHLTAESRICGFIQRDPNNYSELSGMFEMGVTVTLTLILIIYMLRLHKLPGVTYRAIKRITWRVQA